MRFDWSTNLVELLHWAKPRSPTFATCAKPLLLTWKRQRNLAEYPKASEDPIRMYLSQMAEIPLLAREEEIALAKKIEITRKQFRRALLESDYALRSTVGILKRVATGELPFDRTIKVSLTECLTKEQISARMPHNLRTLERLIKQNKMDFDLMVRKSTSPRLKAEVRRRFIRNRRKCLQLVEELSLRSRRVTPLLKQFGRSFASHELYS